MVSSKTILKVSLVITGTIVISVHLLQKYEKKIMQEGVVRNIIRQNEKKLKNGNKNNESNS